MKNEWIRQFLQDKQIDTYKDDDISIAAGLWYYLLTRNDEARECKFVLRFDLDCKYNNPDILGNILIIRNSTRLGNAESKSMVLIETYLKAVTGLHRVWVEKDEKQPDNCTKITVYSGDSMSEAKTSTLVSHTMLMFSKFFPQQIDLEQNPEKLQLIRELGSFIKEHDSGLSDASLLQWLIDKCGAELAQAQDAQNRESFLACMRYQQEELILKTWRQLDNISRRCEEALIQYQNLVEQRNDLEYVYEALACREMECNGINEDLYNLLFHNENIENIIIDNDVITYDVKTTLNNYDIEAYENKTTNINCETMAILDSVSDKHSILKLLNAVFKDERYRIQVINRFQLIMGKTATISLERNIKLNSFSKVQYLYDEHTMFHPHGQGFGCTGNFAKAWNEALEAGNIFAAVNYTVAFTQNHNWHDLTVSRWLVNRIEDNMKHKFIKDTEKNIFVSPQEILKELGEKI